MRPPFSLAALCFGLVMPLALACTSDPQPAPDSTAEPAPGLTTIVDVQTNRATPRTEDPPTLAVEVDGDSHPMRVGTYCWGMVCADAVGILTPPAPVAADAGGTLELAGEAVREPLSATYAVLRRLPDQPLAEGADFTAWSPQGEARALEVDSLSVTLPGDLAPGRYLLAVSLDFAGEGDAVYGLILELA